MMKETYYTNGKDQFKEGVFNHDEWSAPYMVDVHEIKERISGFHLEGRKIKDIHFIGLCYDWREWIEEDDYNEVTGSEEENQRLSDYDSKLHELEYLQFAEIDEPLLIRFENETDNGLDDGDVFEIDTPQEPEFRMSMNCIPWGIGAGTNPPNLDASVLFSHCIGKRISAVEVNTYRTKKDPMLNEDFPDEAEKELVSSIVLRLEDGTGIVIEGWIDFCHVSYVNAANEVLKISFEEVKKGLFNWEDLHIDQVSGVRAYSGTLYFGECGADHCKKPFMTLKPSNSSSRVHIPAGEFTLLGCSISDLYGCFDRDGHDDYSYLQWIAILENAEKQLTFSSFDALADYRTHLKVKTKDNHWEKEFLNEMNCPNRSYRIPQERLQEQLTELREWTALVLGENDSISIYGS